MVISWMAEATSSRHDNITEWELNYCVIVRYTVLLCAIGCHCMAIFIWFLWRMKTPVGFEWWQTGDCLVGSWNFSDEKCTTTRELFHTHLHTHIHTHLQRRLFRSRNSTCFRFHLANRLERHDCLLATRLNFSVAQWLFFYLFRFYWRRPIYIYIYIYNFGYRSSRIEKIQCDWVSWFDATSKLVFRVHCR